jgi:ABC-type tungstate transport system permease subunit
MKNIILRVTALALTAVAFLALSGVASADSSSTVTIIGSNDISDSGLFQNLIAPEFHAAYPQFNLQYYGVGSDAAVTAAEAGTGVTGGASVLLVNAAPLEAQFVNSGYSYNDQPGYAVLLGTDVLAGPAGDPAGVAAGAPTNIAQAFVDIANRGYDAEAGTPAVTFVSAGGTSDPTVQEHAVWALVDSSGLRPATLTLCAASAADGGGETPVASNLGFTNGAACASLPTADQTGGLPSGAGLPDWYVVTGATTSQTVIDANTCTSAAYGGIKSPANSCYAFGARGTFSWLSSGNDPAGKVASLAILAANNASSAPGGSYALDDYFHAYIINQSKVQAASGTKATVDLAGAQDLTTLLTSPGFQAAMQDYLNVTGTSTGNNLTHSADGGGAPFIGDAAPGVSAKGFPVGSATSPAGIVKYGGTVTVSGTITNPEPGYAPLAAQPMSVNEVIAGVSTPVAEGLTGASGNYSIKFSPKTSGVYMVEIDTFTQVENPALTPEFIDTLATADSARYPITVLGAASSQALSIGKIKRAKLKKKATTGKITVTAKLSPGPGLKGATVALDAVNLKTGKQTKIGHVKVKQNKTSVTVSGKLTVRIRYVLQLAYTQSGQKTLHSGLRVVTLK